VRHTVFISRDISDCQALYELLLKNNYVVDAQSLITTKQVAINPVLPPCDWIFFSSSNAVRHFFSQHPMISNQRFGALGEGTAETLREYAQPNFIGDAMDIADSAYRFATEVGTGTILCPIAKHSLKSVRQAFPSGQVIDLIVYETLELQRDIAPSDLYIFSSPSNVRSFFHANAVDPRVIQTIAFGNSTAECLRDFDVEHISIPQSLDPAGMLHTINRIFQG
jgi:uroporphyrinogen-III synthase